MLQNPRRQIEAFVFDVVRAQVPKILLDDVFEKKDDIAVVVESELSEQMAAFGYEIVKALVTDISPAKNLKNAMNEINALTEKRLSGQRYAIINGLKDSVDEFVKNIPGLSEKNVMGMVLLIQYIDTLKEIAGSSKSNVIFVPNTLGNVADLASKIRESIISGQQFGKLL